ncbi:DUF4192 family protein [Herbiconiux sp. P15]|uniref:DUF4192 family protein n=1 Tax=Herbiconiux liukaitaii TaxID=3342799 RepID=UPI0035B958E4
MTTISAPSRARAAAHSPLPSLPPVLRDIESVLGYRPADSVALRVRRRRRPFAVLRVDLPRLRSSGQHRLVDLDASDELLDALGDVVEERVGRIVGATGFDVVGYGPMPVVRRAVDAVTTRLVLVGRISHGAYLVTDEHWCSLALASTPSRTTPPPEPRSHPAPASGAAAASSWVSGMRQGGGRWRPLPPAVLGSRSAVVGDPHRGRFVPLEPAAPDRQAAALAVLEAQQPRTRDIVADLEAWTSALELGSAFDSDPLAIRLAWSLRDRLTRDAVLMLAAWGPDAAFRAVADAFRGGERAGLGGASSGPTSSVVATFTGRGGEAPTEERVRRAVEVLRRVAECVPASLAGPPLVLLAWLEWSRGRGSAAAGYLEACSSADPDYTLARLFRRLIDSGRLPDWCGAR